MFIPRKKKTHFNSLHCIYRSVKRNEQNIRRRSCLGVVCISLYFTYLQQQKCIHQFTIPEAVSSRNCFSGEVSEFYLFLDSCEVHGLITLEKTYVSMGNKFINDHTSIAHRLDMKLL